MVSAAKLKKAQDAILQIRPYADKLYEILTSLSASLENTEDSVYTQQREPENVLIVVINSNRGLCGAFNANISKRAIELALTKYPKQLKTGKLKFLPIGKQAERFLKSNNLPSVKAHNEVFDQLNFESTAIISSGILDNFTDKKYDCIELVYNKFKNAAVQIVTTEQFLPVEIQEKKETATANFNFIYEPSQEYIVQELIPRSLKIQFYKALLDSNAAEHGARMTAMHKATDNATELIRELTLTFNKARQAAITNEILEVTNGSEALNG